MRLLSPNGTNIHLWQLGDGTVPPSTASSNCSQGGYNLELRDSGGGAALTNLTENTYCIGANTDSLVSGTGGVSSPYTFSRSNPSDIGIQGVATPIDPLSSFVGQTVAGDWQVRISDDFGSDVGTINEVCLDLGFAGIDHEFFASSNSTCSDRLETATFNEGDTIYVCQNVVNKGTETFDITVVGDTSNDVGSDLSALVGSYDVRNTVNASKTVVNSFTAGSGLFPLGSHTFNSSVLVRGTDTHFTNSDTLTAAQTLNVTVLDVTAPSAPTSVSINDGDGNISDAERTAGVPVAIALPGDALAGDTVTINTGTGTPLDVVLSAADITAGSITPTLPTANIPTSGTLTASVTVTDASGNTGSAATDTSNVDTAAPSAPTAVSINDGDGNISAIERATGVSVAISLPGDAVAGDTVTINTGTGTPLQMVLSAADITAGSITPTLPTANIPTSGTLTASVTITDAAGNTGSAATDTSNVDTAAPSAPTAVSINDGDGLISDAERTAGVPVAITLPGDAVSGDTVTINTGTGTPIEVVLSAADITAGSITPTLPTANIPASGTLTASVTITDAAGNTGSAATDTSNVDTAAPSAPTAVSINDGDGLISDAERTAGVSVDITLPGDAVAGDTVTVDTGTGTPIEVILSAADITAGSITPTLPTANIPASGTLTASRDGDRYGG